MSLAKIAGRLTLRSVVLIIILLVVTINAAHASDPGRWVYDLFRHDVGVTLSANGSGFAVGPEGETIRFCVVGEACDTVPTITVTRRRPLTNH